jgi:hypothetical protein
MALLAKRAVVGIKVEAVPYTFGTPAVSDTICIPAFDIAVTYSGDVYKRKETRTHYGKLAHIPMWAKCEIAFKTCFKGSGTPATPPDILPFMQACWYYGVASGGTTYTFTPASIDATPNPGKAYSIAVWIDGWRYALKGGLGDVNFVFSEPGPPGIFEFKFSGAYVAPAAVANPLTTGSDATVPPSFLSAVVSLNSVTTMPIQSFSINTGNKVSDLKDANDAAGLLGCIITDREMNGKVTILNTPGTHDPFALWRAGTQFAIQTGVINAAGTAGNRYQLIAPYCQYQMPTLGDIDGLSSVDIPFTIGTLPAGVAGSDFSIAFT